MNNHDLAGQLAAFGGKVKSQLPALLRHYQTTGANGEIAYVNQPGDPKRVRPFCDAVEIFAMFGELPPGYSVTEWVNLLQGFQVAETGLVPEYVWEDAGLNSPPHERPELERCYNTMIVNYALECLDSRLKYPVANAERIDVATLRQVLAGLDWRDNAWGAGDWVDCYGSCLYANKKYFQQGWQIDNLFQWLDANGDPESGMWGARRDSDRWVQPVNGFYRLTRGTYAQFNRPLPFPRQAKETIWQHANDEEFFGKGRGNACYVLDVVHPFWLCLKQDACRREEFGGWIMARLPDILARWQDNRGMAFDPYAKDANGQPGLQGTEMWLSIIYLMADLLGLPQHLGYRPQGVHRTETIW